jgi:Rha family phage regulatory protein
VNELVYLKNEQALTDSLTVAEMFGKEHTKVIRAIENIIGGLPKNGDTPQLFIKTWYKHPQNGERYSKYLMNRDGFSLLVMGFTGKKALEWKLKYISAFNQMEKILTEKQTSVWIETRQQGQLIRKSETDVLQKLVEYAREQGSGHADMLYMTYTKLANKMAGITTRDSATNAQLNELSTMERIIAKVVLEEMAEGIHYKQIYKDCKKRMETVKAWTVMEGIAV